MTTITENILKPYLRKDLPDIRSGDTVRVHQRIKELFTSAKAKKGEKQERERIQIFEGLVIARKHGRGINSMITVRKIIDGVGVERIFPLHLPSIEKIEVVSRAKVRRAKLYYLRNLAGKSARLKQKKGFEAVIYKEKTEEKKEEGKEEGKKEDN